MWRRSDRRRRGESSLARGRPRGDWLDKKGGAIGSAPTFWTLDSTRSAASPARESCGRRGTGRPGSTAHRAEATADGERGMVEALEELGVIDACDLVTVTRLEQSRHRILVEQVEDVQTDVHPGTSRERDVVLEEQIGLRVDW